MNGSANAFGMPSSTALKWPALVVDRLVVEIAGLRRSPSGMPIRLETPTVPP